MLYLNQTDLQQCLARDELRQVMAEALQALSSGTGKSFPRTVVNVAKDGLSPLGFMPARDHSRDLLGYKVITVFESNTKLGLNPHQGLVTLLDPRTGIPRALLNGNEITAVRTAAVSAVATMQLSRKDAATLVLFGAGIQAIEHLKAILNVRPIQKVHVCCRRQSSFQSFVDAIESLSLSVKYFSDPKQALRNADIIVTCTPGHEMLFSIAEVPQGVHINAIGACRPGEQEIEIIDRKNFAIYVDSMQACRLESEEILQAVNCKKPSDSSICGELGALLNKEIPGRQNDDQITLFKSVGLSIEDIYAAEYFYQKALALNLGLDILL